MPRCRPFTLLDAMILTAVAAVWMALMRPRWNQFQMMWTGIRTIPTWQSYIGIAQSGLALSLWLVTMAYLVMRLLRPRPRVSDLIRQPGMLFLGLMIGFGIVLMLLSTLVPLVPWTNVIIGLALGIAWLAACRRYRAYAELGWIEGTGRLVGVGWVATTMAIYPLSLLVA